MKRPPLAIIPILFLLAGSTLWGWYTVSAQRPPDKGSEPGAATPAVSKADAERARANSRAEQRPFLQEFKAKGQGITGLPRLDIPYTGDVYFANLSEMTRDASVIVVGTVRTVDFFAEGSGVPAIPSTVSTFQVERYLKNASTVTGNEISIVQFGGPFKQPTGEVVLTQIAGDPIFTPGERLLLFLRETGDGHFVVDGSRARYAMVNGRVRSLSRLDEDTTWPKQTGKSEQEFIREIEALVP